MIQYDTTTIKNTVQKNLTTFQSRALLKETMKEKKLITKGSKIKQVVFPLCSSAAISGQENI